MCPPNMPRLEAPHKDLLRGVGRQLFCASSLPFHLSYPALSPDVLSAARIRQSPLKVTHRKGLRLRESLRTGLCWEALPSPSHPHSPGLGCALVIFLSKSCRNASHQEGLGVEVLTRPNHLSLIPGSSKMPGKPTPTSCPLTYIDKVKTISGCLII